MYQDYFQDLIPRPGTPRRRTIEGPPRQPPPQTGSQAEIDRNNAAASTFASQRAEAEARKAIADAREAERAAAAGGMTPAQRAGLQTRYDALIGFDRTLDEVETRFRDSFEGSRGGILGYGNNINLGGYLPSIARGENQTFNAASGRIIDNIAEVYGITGGELNSMAELRARLGPFMPTSTDNDETMQSKMAALRNLVNDQRGSLGRQLGLSENRQDMPGAQAGIPRGEVRFGDEDQGPQNPLTPDQQRRYDAWNAANPNATTEQFESFFMGLTGNRPANSADVIRARDAGRGIAPGSAAQRAPEDISNIRGNSGQAFAERGLNSALARAMPFGLGNIFPAADAALGSEGGDAFRRGFMDVPTMGLSDELGATIRAAGGQDFDQSLRQERAVNSYDMENNFGSRLGGQLAGGFTLPFPATGIGRQAAASAAYGGAYGLGSGEGTQRPGQAVGGALLGGTLGAGLGVIGRGAQNRRDTIAAAREIGADVNRMDVGGTPTRMATGIFGSTFGNIPMVEGSRRSAASVGAARDRIADSIGTVMDRAGAGQAAQRGARNFIQTSATRGGELFNRIPIRPETDTVLDNTRAALGELTQGMQSNPELGAIFQNPELQRITGALESGRLSWGDMRLFRSHIGERIGQPSVSGENASPAALRRLYGAISQDMEATASAAGPRALTAFRRANQYWRGREARREGILTDILGAHDDAGAEQAYNRINGWAQERSGNFANVARALRSMPEDEANTVRATIFGRMGQSSAARQDETGVAFSPAEFATQWNSLSERARGALIPNSGHRRALNNLALVTSRMKQSNKYQNFSNTSLGYSSLATAAGMWANPIATIATVAGTAAAGKFLASRPGANWLSRISQARTPAAVRSQMRQLSRVAAIDPAISQEAAGLQRAFSQAMNDNVTPGVAASDPDEDRQRQRRY